MRTWTVTVAENGRVSLPIDLRRVLGLERGGSITLELDDDEVKILTVAARVRRAQALAKKALAGKSISVDDFLSYKREQLRLEEAKMKRLEQRASIEDADS
ncbi:MAG TPA: AbrB/MazE/SpoVT family DNA-binding domain-containing protein [Geminicoccus sp.]|jgi:bifunctional DNA-binding transcriptional regulator/antitoxin component of YhaV-PrlF toxin-antitoxin module|uniref:AbrB/MazE/SpoVT family DNA-binding domain-containing protein n=1 Tax=Geminicoccus sp. TaxID=2024832 RepID=UPI002E3023B0|nr:AbrB/MazE/SpoVT family DNA-binding domain-containing protein [Geminicoccus sp.]HEX2527829.1 AbrB/MazE/SpoVT family DNA-binding domain-containing protein [Geminicoccus sp.]